MPENSGRKRQSSHDSEPPSKRNPYHPVSLKCLVPHQIAGKLLGKGGDRMRALKEIAPKLFMSKNDEYFPHTDERVLFIGGTLDQVHSVLTVVQDKICGASQDINSHQLPPKWRLSQMKIVVANSTCSKIIGNKGEVITQVRDSTDTKITTTPLKQIVGNERVITLSGDDRDVMEALRQILKLVEEDKDARLQNDVSYKKFTLEDPAFKNHNRSGFANFNFVPNGMWNRPGWENSMARMLGGVTAGPSGNPQMQNEQKSSNPGPMNAPMSSNPLELLGAAAAGLGAAAANGQGMNNASMIECLGGLIATIARQQRLGNNMYNGQQ